MCNRLFRRSWLLVVGALVVLPGAAARADFPYEAGVVYEPVTAYRPVTVLQPQTVYRPETVYRPIAVYRPAVVPVVVPAVVPVVMPTVEVVTVRRPVVSYAPTPIASFADPGYVTHAGYQSSPEYLAPVAVGPAPRVVRERWNYGVFGHLNQHVHARGNGYGHSRSHTRW